jgi:hypothetical protein
MLFRDMKIYLYVREIINYIFIRRTIKKQLKTEQWKSLQLRADWVGRIYTVLNIRKEDVGETDTVKRAKVFELMIPVNTYIKSLDLHEIVFPAIEQISDQSYLVVYSPIFKIFTILRTLKYMLYIGALVYLSTYIPTLITLIKTIF